MGCYAATSVIILVAFFSTAPLVRADEATALEVDDRAIQLAESSAITAATSRNETQDATTTETATTDSLRSTPFSDFSSNETDETAQDTETLFRFWEINKKAAGDPEFQRREVQVLTCCFYENETNCNRQCLNHFVESVETGVSASNETTPVLLCSALYELLECSDEYYIDECVEYCRCFSSNPWADAIWGVMSALFFVCMLLTLAVYACVPRLRNMHGKCLVSYLVAVIAGEAVATVGSTLVCGDPNPVAVAAVNYLTLVRYCWVNLLCIDVYCTCQPFQSVRQQPRTGNFSQERRRLLYFSAAAWGGSALVIAALMLVDAEIVLFFYTGIIFLLLAASCIPLILTLARIWETKRQTKKKCLTISRRKLNWFYLTSKLLCLSGAGKLFSVALYFIMRGKPSYNWLFVLLKLEGPITLFLFVCNVRVRSMVRQRLTTLEWISAEKSNDKAI